MLYSHVILCVHACDDLTSYFFLFRLRVIRSGDSVRY